MNSSNSILKYIVAFLVILFFVSMLLIGQKDIISPMVISLSQFFSMVEEDSIGMLKYLENGTIHIYQKGLSIPMQLGSPCDLPFHYLQELAEKGIIIDKPASVFNITSAMNWASGLAQYILPTAILIMFLRSFLPQSNVAPDFFDLDPKVNIEFKDVIGCENAKDGLKDIVDFLKNPKKYTTLGAKIPKGVLFYGPPGTGKTLLAKALAGESGVTFISTQGSAFQETFVAMTAKKITELFKIARKKSPCIVFIDEIDALAPSRNNDRMHIDYIQSINALLTEIDGFKSTEGTVFLVGATNRPDSIDKALLRAGRLDRKVEISLPDIKTRVEMLVYYLKRAQKHGTKVDQNINLKNIAALMYQKSGADIDHLINEVTFHVIRNDELGITEKLLIEYIDNIDLGKEERNKPSHKSLESVAYHEAGHALACVLLQGTSTVIKATILPRNRVRGFVRMGPKDLEDDMVIPEKYTLIERIKILLAARAAEELFLGNKRITSGVSSDFQGAGSIARNMVYMWGMSYGENNDTDEELIGFHDPRVVGYHTDCSMHLSEATRAECDKKVAKILTACYREIRTLIAEYPDAAHALAKALLDYETLSGDQVIRIIDGENVEDVMDEIKIANFNADETPEALESENKSENIEAEIKTNITLEDKNEHENKGLELEKDSEEEIVSKKIRKRKSTLDKEKDKEKDG